MAQEEIRDGIARSLRQIAPEVDPHQIDRSVDLREQIDLDSIDWLNLMLSVHREVGIEIPESDYDQLSTLNGWVAYLAGRLETTPPARE